MDNLIDKEKIDAVWQRVIAANNDTGKITSNTNISSTVNMAAQITHNKYNELDTLREFMDDEANDSLYYKQLANKFKNKRISNLFLEISSDEAEHLRKLQTAYFIITGDSYAPEIKRVQIISIPEALRMRYEAETKGAQAYRDAAEKTNYPKLAAMYLKFASDEEWHAEQIESIIEEIMH